MYTIYKQLLIVCAVIVTFLFLSGCGEDEDDNRIIYGNYLLYEAQATKPIDINLDGQENTDLMKEIEKLSVCDIDLNGGDYPNIGLVWPEFRMNDGLLLTGMPIEYNDTMRIEYLPVINQYYVRINEDQQQIKPYLKFVNDFSIYTFNFPDKFTYNASLKEITFSSSQLFLLKSGRTTCFFTAKFRLVE